MMTKIALSAQCAHTTNPVILKRNLPNKVESHLNHICHGESITHIYKDESRPWWEFVDNDKVYETISDELFQTYVYLMTVIA